MTIIDHYHIIKHSTHIHAHSTMVSPSWIFPPKPLNIPCDECDDDDDNDDNDNDNDAIVVVVVVVVVVDTHIPSASRVFFRLIKFQCLLNERIPTKDRIHCRMAIA